MNVTITPARLHGAVTPPPSKSQAHRLIIAAALAEGESEIANVALSQDITATLGCMRALGAKATVSGDRVRICGIGQKRTPYAPCMCGAVAMDCGESGSTLRFLIPVALAVAGGGIFTGRGRLLRRPQQPYAELFVEKGIFFAQEAQAITVGGELKPGVYRLPGNVSSQFFTGLLYALSLLDGDSVVESTTALESRDYIRMTIQALSRFGVEIREEADRFLIPGGQKLTGRTCAVEADWSQAGFWYAAVGLGSELDILGLHGDSAQPDRVIADYARALDGPGDLDLDVSGCPDLAPPLAAYAALRAGRMTRLINAARLRIKESDRLAAITATLTALGAEITEYPDSLTIRGLPALPGGATVSGCNDHRIAMMTAIAATRCLAPVTVTGAECVAKSYPDFWEVYAGLGGKVERTETV